MWCGVVWCSVAKVFSCCFAAHIFSSVCAAVATIRWYLSPFSRLHMKRNASRKRVRGGSFCYGCLAVVFERREPGGVNRL